MDTLETFKSFLDDSEAPEMYLVGPAGTGKTTSLAELVYHCVNNNTSCSVMAYTHKAKDVLKSKIKFDDITTLHSFLTKRPTINIHATKVKHLEGNTQMREPERKKVVFIDEFSMVGDRDYTDLMAMQYNEEGELVTKVVFIGDINQLPPVKDVCTIEPKGDYVVKLTKVYRQADDNGLLDNLIALNAYINGGKAEQLAEHENLVRGVDIVKGYKACNGSKLMLAYTNAQVEYLNAQVQGRKEPLIGDALFSSTLKQHLTLENIEVAPDFIVKLNGDLLEISDDKYKVLRTLQEMQGVQYMYLMDEEDRQTCRAVVFGHDNYNRFAQELAKTATTSNKNVEAISNGEQAKVWCNKNWKHPLAKKRKDAWKYYLAFKDCVICLDFPHAMTVHKSQGSTYDTVFIDTDDLHKCANHDFKLYLKLLYVAISRAAKRVYTN